MKKLLLCLLLLAPLALRAQSPSMSNADVIKMKQAGMSDSVIIAAINGSPAGYDTSANGLIALKGAQVSDAVIAAMITRASGASAAPAPGAAATASAAPAGVDEIGVYYQKSGGPWTLVPSEIVNFKSGGVLKSIGTYGIVKGDINGHLNGAKSSTHLSTADSLLVYAKDGDNATDYILVKLRENSDNREFRSKTGGVFHESGGASRDNVAFTATRIAPHIYQLSFPTPLAKGEYGIIPPGAMSTSNMASGGKAYTFSIIE